jgi:hypothetical protein
VGLVGGAAALGFLLYRQLGHNHLAVGPAPAHAPAQAAPDAPVPSAADAPVGSLPGVLPPAALAPTASGLAASAKAGAALGARELEGATKPDAPLSSTRRAGSRRPGAGSESEPSVASRDVVVRITGAMGGTLRIDGEQVQWFGGVPHPLTLGPHRFEFVAPENSNCCLGSERTVNVVAGDGPQQVIGEIPFLDAVLRVTAEDGQLGLLTCPTLFSGEQRFPGEVHIKMSRVTVTGTCTLRGEASSAPPQKSEVTLRAGQTQVIPWP